MLFMMSHDSGAEAGVFDDWVLDKTQLFTIQHAWLNSASNRYSLEWLCIVLLLLAYCSKISPFFAMCIPCCV